VPNRHPSCCATTCGPGARHEPHRLVTDRRWPPLYSVRTILDTVPWHAAASLTALPGWRVVAVAPGSSNTVILTMDGRVWGLVENAYGWNWDQPAWLSPIPPLFSWPANARRHWAGNAHTLYLGRYTKLRTPLSETLFRPVGPRFISSYELARHCRHQCHCPWSPRPDSLVEKSDGTLLAMAITVRTAGMSRLVSSPKLPPRISKQPFSHGNLAKAFPGPTCSCSFGTQHDFNFSPNQSVLLGNASLHTPASPAANAPLPIKGPGQHHVPARNQRHLLLPASTPTTPHLFCQVYGCIVPFESPVSPHGRSRTALISFQPSNTVVTDFQPLFSVPSSASASALCVINCSNTVRSLLALQCLLNFASLRRTNCGTYQWCIQFRRLAIILPAILTLPSALCAAGFKCPNQFIALRPPRVFVSTHRRLTIRCMPPEATGIPWFLKLITPSGPCGVSSPAGRQWPPPCRSGGDQCNCPLPTVPNTPCSSPLWPALGLGTPPMVPFGITTYAHQYSGIARHERRRRVRRTGSRHVFITCDGVALDHGRQL